jgi:DNA-directed RNA polymerase subunit M/transcription elongation factor TFIIS
MSDDVRIVQPCPNCKQRLHIRMSYVGSKVACRHCQHQFTVRDPAASQFVLSDSGLALLHRVDEMLEQTQQQSRMKQP